MLYNSLFIDRIRNTYNNRTKRLVRQAQIQCSTSFSLFVNSLQSEATQMMYSIRLDDFMKHVDVSDHDNLLIEISPLVGGLSTLRPK